MASALLLVACGPRPTPPWHQEQGYRWRELEVSGGEPGFTAIAPAKTGITFQNDVSDSLLLGNRILGQGGGVALGDIDGDGRVDIFLAKTEGCSALYRNLGDWKFEDITKSAGVGACDRHSTGAAFADVDGNGTLDLVLLSTTGPNAIFLNDGKGHFTERRDLGLDTAGDGGTTVAMADVDGSGRLAMYIATYKPYFIDDSIPPQQRAFNQLVREVAPKAFEVVKERQRDYRIVMRPDMGGMRMTQRAAPDEFYTNDGSGRFTRVAMTGGRFRDASGKPVAADFESFTLGARFVDLNGDGVPDLYVANDFEDTDQLWFNDGHGNFRLADWTSQRQQSNSTMGLDVADVNGDGLPDLFTVDMLANDSHRLRTQIPTNTAFPKKPGQMELQLQHQRNALFINRGDGTFSEVAQYAGVPASGWSWGTILLDVDLDGRPDILIANGHLWDIMDADVQEALQTRLNAIDWRKIRWQFPKLALKNVAYRNRGDLTFEDVSEKWGFGKEADVSHAIAAADLDGDGDLDVVVNRLGSPALILRNNAKAPRVAVRVTGDAPNTQAIGAVVQLLNGAVPIQSREVTVGGIYMSHSENLASFAIRASDTATIVVKWRDGRTSRISGVRANRLYEITTATAGGSGMGSGKEAPVPGAGNTQPLFEDATAELRGHTHVEPEFDDWGRQFLLPSALSPLGPGVAWFDAERSGHEDLIVGTGKGGRIAMFRNSNGHLSPGGQFPVAPMGLTGVLGIADGNGAKILAGVSTWQATSDSEMVKQPAVLGYALSRGAPAGAAEPVVPSHASATGPIAIADYAGDGRLGLFVGSRAVPMKYPLPASSGLFRNVGGKFVFDTANAAVLRDIGMVSAAMFVDVNGDGHPDLVLAREWGSMVLLLNDGRGRFARAPNDWGLGKWTSRWNGVTAGDIDGDGRIDIIATSWGRNTPFHASEADPLMLYHGPIGARGEQEMLLAQKDPRVGGIAPLTSYARARVAIPDIVGNAPTFGAYADATIEKILGRRMAEVSSLSANTLDNIVFLNRGDHFEAVSLPAEAQFAPAFYAGVADFNGDGADDLFLAQNFSETMVGAPRDDAGRGLLLLNDGKGGLVPMSGTASGIKVYGDQRGAAYADYDGDGRVDLAVSQNGAATRLFHNRGAKPGLRVRLRGAGANPDALGAQVRVVFGERMSPVREIQAGSGYWSQNGAVQVFGIPSAPTEVWVRWAGGATQRVKVPAGAREVEVTQPSR